MAIFFMKRTAISSGLLFLLLSAPALAMSSNNSKEPDIIRERMGLEVIESQLGKIIEHSESLKTYSDQSANRKFNYQAFEIQIKNLQDQITEYLEHPPLPRGVDALQEK
ncbi:hypothetical protein [Vibrio gangliei]|uniref:hypothetical protein n=2 Tax=Vibrio gangliei TaxID=2077090 RepID=UPI00222F86D6|nr:hypothetical protein [Vibrio gangliei]